MELKKLMSSLAGSGLTVATAESASAGYLSYMLTKTPGSSKIFKGGLVVYSLESKRRFFRIPAGPLDKTQGVSASIALTLSKKVRRIFNADWGLAIVGFAGPERTKGRKGLFFISVAGPGGARVEKLICKGGRDKARTTAAGATLALLNKMLCDHSLR